MKNLRPKNVRVRLTLWYVAILGFILLLYGVTASVFVFWQLRSEVDRLAAEELETIGRATARFYFNSQYAVAVDT